MGWRSGWRGPSSTRRWPAAAAACRVGSRRTASAGSELQPPPPSPCCCTTHRLEREHGIVARFVIGQSADPAAEAALAADAAAHADFLRLEGLVEGYAGLPTKTLTFLRVRPTHEKAYRVQGIQGCKARIGCRAATEVGRRR